MGLIFVFSVCICRMVLLLIVGCLFFLNLVYVIIFYNDELKYNYIGKMRIY